VGLVAYAALATMRGYVGGEEPETSPAVAADQPAGVPAATAPIRPNMAEPVAIRLAD